MLALAGCGGAGFSEVTFHNDLDRRARIGSCARGDATCRRVSWWIAIDPGQRATQEIPNDGKRARFVVSLPPERVLGCFVFGSAGRRPPETVELADARGCGSGR